MGGEGEAARSHTRARTPARTRAGLCLCLYTGQTAAVPNCVELLGLFLDAGLDLTAKMTCDGVASNVAVWILLLAARNAISPPGAPSASPRPRLFLRSTCSASKSAATRAWDRVIPTVYAADGRADCGTHIHACEACVRARSHAIAALPGAAGVVRVVCDAYARPTSLRRERARLRRLRDAQRCPVPSAVRARTRINVCMECARPHKRARVSGYE